METLKKTLKKTLRININFIDFIAKLIESKIEISDLNKNKIAKDYEKDLELKFTNLKRVSRRNQREKVKSILLEELKEHKIDLKTYIQTSTQLEAISF